MIEEQFSRSAGQNRVIITGMVLCMIFIPLVSLSLTGMKMGLPVLFYSRVIIWMDVLLIFAYAHFAEKQNFLLWTEKQYTLKFYLASIGILFLLQIGARLLSAIPQMLGYHENYAILVKVMALVKSNKWAFLFTVVTAGITEELLMRGYIQPRLALFFKNKYVPIILSSALFAALHFNYHSLVEILFPFFFGILAAAYYQKYRNIMVLIIFHALVDFLALYFAK